MSICPSCHSAANRIYKAPGIFAYSKEIRDRVEKGMEPKKMSRSQLGPQRKTPHHKHVGRPWQIAHE
jgi:hypothetical protein